MWTCRLQVSLLVVCLPFVFTAPAKAQYLNEPYVVANVGGPLWWSDAAYNPARNEYCMTWQNGYIIRWRRLDSTGAVLGSEFAIADGVTSGHHWSTISYNSVQQEYLILYSGWMADNSDQMRLLRVNATTAQIGGTIFLDAIGTNSTTGGLDIAYSSTSNSYMAVYESYTEGNVYSRRLDAFGNPTGSRIQIDTPSHLYSRNPQVAWNSANNEYLVTYMGSLSGTGFDYFAQRVSASTGALLGSNLALTTSNSIYNFGGVAYDSNANKYLVVYDGGASPPYGQFVSNTATLLGSAFAIGAGTSTGWGVAAAYDSSKHEFLVSWSANQSASNFSRRVTESGSFGSNITDNTSTWATIGTGNWPPRPVYNTVNDEYLIHWHNSYATILDRRYKSSVTQTSVSINLGNTNIEDLMTSPIGGDGDTVGATGIGGLECRRNMDPGFNDFYFYFAVNDGWAFQGNKQDVWIYVDYYDNATTGSITLNYDAVSSAYKDGGTVYLTGTNSWKTQKWHVTDAYFGNRENNGGDFRIYVGNVVRYLDTSTVNQNTPNTTPPGQASNPSPANGATGVSTTPTLTWTGGVNATTHNVFFGTSNPPPFVAGQTTTSYAPGTLTAGTTYYSRIDEYRSGGGTTNGVGWSFTVGGTPPGPATNPNPANGATGVAINSSLSWTAGSGATSHDVNFGTTNPPQFIQNQAGTSYTPPTMTPNTTYFWRIDEKNSSGTTTGTVWSFTTLPLPGLASAPSPANAATGVSITAALSWTAGSNATSHDVRFGTANPPPFIQNQAGTTYNPGTLSAGTTYFWRIDEKNSSGTTTGTVWSFSTLPLPGLASAPNPANGATGVSITTSLSWTAGSNATSHDVSFGTTNPPPFVQNQAGASYTPPAMIGNTTYFWRIDEKNGSGTTTGTVWSFTTTFCYLDSFAYTNGSLNGIGGWTGSATSEIQISSQTVLINGGAVSKDSLHTTSCGASGTGLIQIAVKIAAGSGVNTMWSLWFDDAASVNMCRWYGSGTTARGRIGGTATVTATQTLTGGWDNLLVKINPTAKTSEFFFNGTSLGVLSFTGQGAGSTLGRVRFERLDNSGAAGNFLSFDALVVY